MHWNVEQILWALVLAAHLVLLIVLMGRDRIRRFPWFTALIVLTTVHLIADHLLQGKFTTIAFYWQSYSTLALMLIVSLLVLVELARQIFAGGRAGLLLKPRGWIGAAMTTFGLAALALWAWGRPWPTWASLNAQPGQRTLLLLVIAASRGDLFVGMLTFEAALLMRAFGRRFGSGWKSHAQQIALGLSTIALVKLAVQAIAEAIKRTVHLTTQQEYQRVLHLFKNLENAQNAVWLLAVVWWIVWLWPDEPGSANAAPAKVQAPVLPGPPVIDGEVAEESSDWNEDAEPSPEV